MGYRVPPRAATKFRHHHIKIKYESILIILMAYYAKIEHIDISFWIYYQ